MSKTLAENLSDMSIMGTDGTELGQLHNVTMNINTGSLEEFLVVPREGLAIEQVPFQRDEDGYLVVPATRVEAVRDYIVVRN